jgi:hypothetical protein
LIDITQQTPQDIQAPPRIFSACRMSIVRNILDAKELPHDPDLVATLADRVQSYLRDRAKRGDVVKTGKR